MAEKRDVLLEVKSFLKDTSSYQNNSIQACILFADLVGSTEFKRGHSVVEGLAKTVQHNEIASRCIENSSGRVVKYIGDEVMGIFEGPESERLALESALDIIKEIGSVNQKRNWGFPYAMSTKIGIHSGPVWMFEYDGNCEDPQGTTVDIAARLTSVAGPDQIICTNETYDKACQNGNFPKPIAKSKRYLKGLKDIYELYAIMHEGYCGQSAFGKQTTPLQKRLDEVKQFMNEKKLDTAFIILNELIDEDPGNYQVNIYLAEYWLIKGNNAIEEDQGRSILNKVEWHLKQASYSRPDFCQVWLLFSWLFFKYYEISKDTGHLEDAIENTRKALSHAENWLNLGSILQAKVNLINFLSLHAKETGDQGKLDEARNLCVEVHPFADNVLNECRSEFYLAYASTLNMSGSTEYKQMEEMLQKAQELNPKSIRIHRVAEEINKRRYSDNSLNGILYTSRSL